MFLYIPLVQMTRGWPGEGMKVIKVGFKKRPNTEKGSLKFNQVNDWRKQK